GFTLFPRPAESPQEARGADRRKPESARRLIRGQTEDYGVWVDRDDWKPAWSPSTDGDLIFTPVNGGDWGAYTVAMAKRISFLKMADLFIDSIAVRGGSPRVVRREIRRINDNDFLCVELSSVWHAVDVRMLGCFFANDRV